MRISDWSSDVCSSDLISRLLSVTWGSQYVNDFLHEGRVKRVYLQGDAPYRMLPEDFDAWYLRAADGDMTPLSEVTSGRWGYGSPRLERFNGVPSRQIQGEPAQIGRAPCRERVCPYV